MIVMYHNIDVNPGFNTIAVDNLMKQIEYLKSHFQIVSMDQYVNDLSLNLKKKNIAITVDDGYSSFNNYFYPLLKKYSLPVTLFIPTDFIGKYNVWDKERKIDLMQMADLKNIATDTLVTIGSHGKSHIRLSHLSNSQVVDEITSSKMFLENELCIKINHFSFPYGQLNDFNQFSIKAIKDAGYISACSTRYGIKNSKANLFSLFRVEIEPDDNIDDFKKKCNLHFHKKYIKRNLKESLIKLGMLK